VALALFTVALSGAALAQDYEHQVRANIPFNFYAAGKLQHAGTYTFGINLENYNLLMASREMGGGSFIVALPDGGSKNGLPTLTFRTNGDDVYVLQKVQWADFGATFDIKQVLKHVAEHRSVNGTQTVLAQLIK
jgi:hypothetical protein